MQFQIFGLIFSFLSNRRLRVALDRKFSREYPGNAGIRQGSILGPTFFLLCITDLMMLSVILLSMLMILLSILSVIRHLICSNNLNWLPRDTVDWGKKWLVDFSAGKSQMISFDQSNNNGSIDVKMDGSVLEKKSSFKMLGLTFSSKLGCVCHIISIAKTASQKMRILIRSMKFLSSEVALYLYKSSIHPCMEFCCHIWAGAPSFYSELLYKLQKWICRTVGLSLAASLELLAHHRKVATLNFFL